VRGLALTRLDPQPIIGGTHNVPVPGLRSGLAPRATCAVVIMMVRTPLYCEYKRTQSLMKSTHTAWVHIVPRVGGHHIAPQVVKGTISLILSTKQPVEVIRKKTLLLHTLRVTATCLSITINLREPQH